MTIVVIVTLVFTALTLLHIRHIEATRASSRAEIIQSKLSSIKHVKAVHLARTQRRVLRRGVSAQALPKRAHVTSSFSDPPLCSKDPACDNTNRVHKVPSNCSVETEESSQRPLHDQQACFFFSKLRTYHKRLLTTTTETARSFKPWKGVLNISATLSSVNCLSKSNFHLFLISIFAADFLSPVHISVIFEAHSSELFTRALVVNNFDGTYLAGVWLPTVTSEWKRSEHAKWNITVVVEYVLGQAWPMDKPHSIRRASQSTWWYIGKRIIPTVEEKANARERPNCQVIKSDIDCDEDLLGSLSFGVWSGRTWIPASASKCMNMQNMNILVVGDSTSRGFATYLKEHEGVSHVLFYQIYGGLKDRSIRMQGFEFGHPPTIQKWFHAISESVRKSKEDNVSYVVILNSGIHDIARDNLFQDFARSLRKLKKLLVSHRSKHVDFIWRLSSSVHESAMDDPKLLERAGIDFRNTMTALRNEINAFQAARIVLPEIKILDGFMPSRCAPDSAMLNNDIRHLHQYAYAPWARALRKMIKVFE
ncbi:hypothetical protein RI054_16g76890 [Pseudoscourfieldia marina]